MSRPRVCAGTDYGASYMGLIRYLMSGDSRKSLKKLNKMADRVEALAPKYQPMTDAELKAQTGILKERLQKGETLDDILYDAFAVLREASACSGCAISMFRSSAVSVSSRGASPK